MQEMEQYRLAEDQAAGNPPPMPVTDVFAIPARDLTAGSISGSVLPDGGVPVAADPVHRPDPLPVPDPVPPVPSPAPVPPPVPDASVPNIPVPPGGVVPPDSPVQPGVGQPPAPGAPVPPPAPTHPPAQSGSAPPTAPSIPTAPGPVVPADAPTSTLPLPPKDNGPVTTLPGAPEGSQQPGDATVTLPAPGKDKPDNGKTDPGTEQPDHVEPGSAEPGSTQPGGTPPANSRGYWDVDLDRLHGFSLAVTAARFGLAAVQTRVERMQGDAYTPKLGTSPVGEQLAKKFDDRLNGDEGLRGLLAEAMRRMDQFIESAEKVRDSYRAVESTNQTDITGTGRT
ncbi:hypothetical protein V5P93_001026 [Actinokineospora auranticolor]|uniref:Uncharacterized protein n=1 Tax=Actinokineospora auranticolor TaxID=155976 RepID=A0A2S6GY39_9PSEU|nr:hypothetical protein [Actinokineospora auranticolor]PPK70096.1 hypothetical protein CLV40_1026 [Actinokineospora auranticolor]